VGQEKGEAMKKIVIALALIGMFISGAVLADVQLNNTHKGKKKGDQVVNCAYCHTTGAIPKQGKDYAKYKTTDTCKGSGCH
jgi:hypothetical protein